MKKFLALLLVMMLAVMFAACGGAGSSSAPAAPAVSAGSTGADSAAPASAAGGDLLVGVAMPARSLERWVKEGEIIKGELEAKGYQVDLQFAENDVQTQISQIENMITSGAGCLVITPVDNTALNNVLQTAADQGIPVVAYDRLIMNTENVSYLVTFDNVKVGENSVKEALARLDVDNRDEPVNFEIFTGDSADQNSYTFYEGVMNILQDYLDSGKVVIPSGQIEFDQVSVADWSQENALKRLENILSGYYSDGTPIHAILGPADAFTYAYVSALEAAGYVPGSEEWPITSGQDCEVMAVVNILNDKTTFSNWRDGRVEAAQLMALIDAVLNGTTPPTTTEFDNGVKMVPTIVCQATIVDKDNAKAELVDGGYYTAAELGL